MDGCLKGVACLLLMKFFDKIICFMFVTGLPGTGGLQSQIQAISHVLYFCHWAAWGRRRVTKSGTG